MHPSCTSRGLGTHNLLNFKTCMHGCKKEIPAVLSINTYSVLMLVYSSSPVRYSCSIDWGRHFDDSARKGWTMTDGAFCGYSAVNYDVVVSTCIINIYAAYCTWQQRSNSAHALYRIARNFWRASGCHAEFYVERESDHACRTFCQYLLYVTSPSYT